MSFGEPSTIKCIKGVATRVWDEEFCYLIMAEDEAHLFGVLNKVLPADLAEKFKRERFRRVAVFVEGEPFKE